MFKKLFGKKDKFFLEIKEDAAKVVEQAEKAIEKTTETITQVVETAEAKTSETAKASKFGLPFGGKPKEKTAKTSIKDKKAKKTEAKPAPAPSSSQNGKVDPKDVAFASKNEVASTMSRRTPGPSLNPFKEMARTVKVPKRKG